MQNSVTQTLEPPLFRASNAKCCDAKPCNILYMQNSVMLKNRCKLVQMQTHVGQPLKREPQRFAKTRFLVDRFHNKNHVACSLGYDWMSTRQIPALLHLIAKFVKLQTAISVAYQQHSQLWVLKMLSSTQKFSLLFEIGIRNCNKG